MRRPLPYGGGPGTRRRTRDQRFQAAGHLSSTSRKVKRLLASRLGSRDTITYRRDLVRLAEHYGTDKAAVHGYLRHYQSHLAARRRDPLVLIEIGIGPGGSLRMWRDHLPRASVYGIDLAPAYAEERRITTFAGDQSDPRFLAAVLAKTGTPDVVIDDGSHVCGHVRATFEYLFPRLAPDGWYIVEDLHASYRASHGGAPPGQSDGQTSVGMIKELLDGLSFPYADPTIADVADVTPSPVAAIHAYDKIVFIRKRATAA